MSVQDTMGVLDVAGYASAVRRSLADLGQEQVEDLTDDLEADLAEALTDERHAAHGRGVLEQFGPPEDYAVELRAAAGLAPASRAGRVRLFSDPVEDSRRLGRWTLRSLRTLVWWPPVESFLVALRPAWWLLRGWVVYQLVAMVLGSQQFSWLPWNLAAFLVLAGCVVLSVQWGRGAWFQSRRLAWVPLTANVVAVVAVLPLLGSTQDWVDDRERIYDAYQAGNLGGVGSQTSYPGPPVDGVVVDGMQVSNLFVYDAEGNPLTDVQVYDDRGRPVRTTFDDGRDAYWFPEGTEPWSFVSRVDSDGRARWNVYPLQGAPSSQFTYDDEGAQVLLSGNSAVTPPWPFAKAPALDAPAEAVIGAEGVTPSASPSTTP